MSVPAKITIGVCRFNDVTSNHFFLIILAFSQEGLGPPPPRLPVFVVVTQGASSFPDMSFPLLNTFSWCKQGHPWPPFVPFCHSSSKDCSHHLCHSLLLVAMALPPPWCLLEACLLMYIGPYRHFIMSYFIMMGLFFTSTKDMMSPC